MPDMQPTVPHPHPLSSHKLHVMSIVHLKLMVPLHKLLLILLRIDGRPTGPHLTRRFLHDAPTTPPPNLEGVNWSEVRDMPLLTPSHHLTHPPPHISLNSLVVLITYALCTLRWFNSFLRFENDLRLHKFTPLFDGTVRQWAVWVILMSWQGYSFLLRYLWTFLNIRNRRGVFKICLVHEVHNFILTHI